MAIPFLPIHKPAMGPVSVRWGSLTNYYYYCCCCYCSICNSQNVSTPNFQAIYPYEDIVFPHDKAFIPLNPSAIRFIPNTIGAGITHVLDPNARPFSPNIKVIFIGHRLNPNASTFLPNTKEMFNVNSLNPNATIFSPKNKKNFTLDPNATVFNHDLNPEIVEEKGDSI